METCLIDPKLTCWGSRLVYALSCSKCPAIYVGTTGLTAHRRSLDHQQALRRGDEGYAIAKHYAVAHPGEQGADHPFTFKLLSAATSWQTAESCQINLVSLAHWFFLGIVALIWALFLNRLPQR